MSATSKSDRSSAATSSLGDVAVATSKPSLAEQELQRVEDVDLIVGDENAA